ncbi:MAG: DUF4129 domain-containing protein [Ardenticatenaceae bacterium]|nr:DUF4129 domain-containing protein [Ardenticatenaceae bacterium]MCB8947232.1 DUF4129 domain-containing protein [Ardenticatenaceae bacterium]
MSLKAAEKKPNDDAKEFFLSLDDPRLAFITNKWSRTIVQPLLISLLITSLLSSVLALAQIISRQDIWLPFSLFFLFVTLEGCYTTLWLQQPERRLLNHTAYRAAEFVLLLLLLRLFTWIVVGNWPEFSSLPDILRRPQLILLDAPFIVSGLLGLFGWERAIALGQTFNALSIDQAEVYYYSRPTKERIASDKPVRTNRGAIVFTFFRQWIAGALILAVVTSMSNFDVVDLYRGSSLALARQGLPSELLLFLLVYFLAGFTLLSQAQLAAMNARWLINGVTRTGHVEKSWHRYTLILLGGIALLAAFLPIGSTFAISSLIGAIITGLSAVATFLMTLISTLLALFLSLFTGGPREEGLEPLVQPTIPPLPTPTATPIPSSLPPPIVDTGLITSSLFWAVAIVMSVTAVSFFLRERGVRLNTAVLQRFWQQLLHWLQITWKEAGHQVQDWQQAVRTRLQRQPKEDEENQPPWRFIRLNSLSPREQIRYFYLSTVKRATDKGVARQQAETPLEFAQDLKENWPEAEEDVDALTEAFLEARYGRSPIEKEDVNPVKKRWRQVKSSLRRK